MADSRPSTANTVRTVDADRDTLLAYAKKANSAVVGCWVGQDLARNRPAPRAGPNEVATDQPALDPRPHRRPIPPVTPQKTLQAELARTSGVASTLAASLEAARGDARDAERRLARLTSEHVDLLKCAQGREGYSRACMWPSALGTLRPEAHPAGSGHAAARPPPGALHNNSSAHAAPDLLNRTRAAGYSPNPNHPPPAGRHHERLRRQHRALKEFIVLRGRQLELPEALLDALQGEARRRRQRCI